MAKVLQGDRIGKTGQITLGCSAVLFDSDLQRILMTRRTDNDRWCLPGGRVDPGESVAEACLREMVEETGLLVEIVRFLGVYSDPNYLIEYASGNRCQIVALNFEVKLVGGELGLSNETNAYGYYTRSEIRSMDVMDHQRQRIEDAFDSLEQHTECPWIR